MQSFRARRQGCIAQRRQGDPMASKHSARMAGDAPEDLVRVYLNNVGQYQLLSRQDEGDLSQDIEAGRSAKATLLVDGSRSGSERRRLRRLVITGDKATETFIQANLRLVVSIAKRYQATGLPLLDLIQDGK